MIMTVFAGIAEIERDLVRERTTAGRKAAMQRGVRFGKAAEVERRSAQIDPFVYWRRVRGVAELARSFKVHTATIYRLQKGG
jgi:DNA invertase Pin-like site-specific DNA recombinase